MPHVRLQNLFKEYESGVQAINDLSIDIEAGQFLVLMGPSGCGKTTTLRMIAGLDSPTKGRIFIDNNDVTQIPPGQRNIGMVFQNFALYPHKTVFDNLAFGMTIRKINKQSLQKNIQEIAQLLDLDTLLNRFPDQLSGGQKQRVALGRALLRGSDLLLFDEPLSNLDSKLRYQLRLEIAALHKKKGFTGIFVTHDHQEAMTLADKIALLNNGKLVQLGTPEDIYFRPINHFAATFSSYPPMNLFFGQTHNNIWRNNLFELPANPATTSLGLRPEFIKLGEGVITFFADIIQSEWHGQSRFHHAQIGETRFTCMGTTAVEPGTRHAFSFNPKDSCFFDNLGVRID